MRLPAPIYPINSSNLDTFRGYALDKFPRGDSHFESDCHLFNCVTTNFLVAARYIVPLQGISGTVALVIRNPPPQLVTKDRL